MRSLILIALFASTGLAQLGPADMPKIEPGVSHELAKWRAARYSDVRYKLNLTLEKMSPVLKGTIEIRVKLSEPPASAGGTQNSPPYEGGVAAALGGRGGSFIVLDWRKIKGYEDRSVVSNISINGHKVLAASRENHPVGETPTPLLRKEGSPDLTFSEDDEHLIFRDGVVLGENVIKLDFTSPILTSGSAITRYVDKEDGSEYIYSLFVPSDASTAFPVFDQPDLKARFGLNVIHPKGWIVRSNASKRSEIIADCFQPPGCPNSSIFYETKPISTYVFAFTAGQWVEVRETVPTAPTEVLNSNAASVSDAITKRPIIELPPSVSEIEPQRYGDSRTHIYVRMSQAAKFKSHAAEVFRLNREGIKYLETYFDYKFPFPKYDLVLIPEFPFGGMEHAGATFLREDRIIFPQEPTKNDYVTRANLIFHEAAHQWFGDTMTMKWFDDLWLKEGFAEYMAYKTLEKVMPEYNAWKIFYERNKQAAYLTDSTKGTTPIYQEIANLNAAKSAYGNIVYRKAPSFLKQAEFYIGVDKFQTAVRAFLKKYEFGNAGWEDLVMEFEAASGQDLKSWAAQWVKQPGLPIYRPSRDQRQPNLIVVTVNAEDSLNKGSLWPQKTLGYYIDNSPDPKQVPPLSFEVANGKMLPLRFSELVSHGVLEWNIFFPNYQDYGYGIFLLDDKSRDYVLKNIQNEKDDFLRTMMWGSLWDSVREGELDPREYVQLVVGVLSKSDAFTRSSAAKGTPKGVTLTTETDESTIQTLLGRVSTAMRYYLNEPADTQTRLESLLIDRMQNASTPGQRITYYRAFLNMASSENARRIMKAILKGSEPPTSAGGTNSGKISPGGKQPQPRGTIPPAYAGGSDRTTKDRFDIVSRLIILGDPEALKLLADLEKTETSDEAKRYAYAARAGIATAENKAKYWNDFVNNKQISESWIEAAFGPFNNIRHSELTLPYLEKALAELPNLKRNRKIFFVNGWLGAFIGGQRSEKAIAAVNKFLADNPGLDRDLRLKILENLDTIERAVKIRGKYEKPG